MKRITVILLSFLMLTSMVACGSEDNSSLDRKKFDNVSVEDYSFITVKDLDNHCGEIVGKKVLIVDKIGDIKSENGEDYIQISVPDTYHFDSFYMASDSVAKPGEFEDQTVAIVGIIKEKTNMFLFTSAKVTECYIIASNKEAEKYRKDITDDSLSILFAGDNTNIQAISESEYKSNCTVFDSQNYEDVLRNPDTYKKRFITKNFSVDQIIDGWFGSYTIYALDENGNKWELSYTYKEGEQHVLENDSITIWGELNGTSNSTTIFGKQITLPKINVKYIEL